MNKLATSILLIGVLAVGLITLYLALNAASIPFAIHMSVMAAWALIFIAFIVKRAKRPA